ncbi:hypothetical protein [Sinorhizobium sp. P24N7]|uniref:hypothetical protein n=1 Tax=Sinorhizobium sp. P24N7 TaxID=3348358 RepID=UPI0036D427B9
MRDLVLAAEPVNYRRERWLTPEGKVIVAPLPEGVSSGFGRNLRRVCLALHAQGQVTTPRLTAILNSIDVEISKRQVIRLLTTGLDPFVEEDSAVLHAGLVSAPFITVDDTGAQHNRRNAFTTQIGGEHFSTFRTSLSKSRLNFLSALRSGHQDYVLNDEAMNWMKAQGRRARDHGQAQDQSSCSIHRPGCVPRAFGQQGHRYSRPTASASCCGGGDLGRHLSLCI